MTLPDQTAKNSQMMQMLWQHNYQQQRMTALQQNRELVRQQKSAQFVDANLNDKNYATGTAADPLINNMTSAARMKFAKLIHENPNMDEGDLEMQMQNEIGKISQYSALIKAGRKQIDDGVQHYKDQPGIDTDALRQGAMTNLLYQGGNKVVDDPSKIDLNKNYIDDELQARPDHYVIGDMPIMNSIEHLKPKKGGDTTINENMGVTHENKYTDQIYPYQQLKTDAKGSVTGVQMKGVPATLSNGQTLTDPETNKPMQVVDDNTMKMVMTHGVAAQLKRDTDDYIKANGYNPQDFTPGSEAYNILGKHILYKKLESLTPSEFTHETKKTNASIVDKMQLGIVDALGRTLSKADEKKKDELLNGNFGKLRQAVNLSPQALQAAVPYTDPSSGRQFLDVTDFVGGFNTSADKKATQYDPGYKQIGRVLIDPANPGKMYTSEGTDGHIQEYDSGGIDAVQLRHAAANGHKDLTDVKTIINNIPIKPDISAARQARAEMEYKRRQQQAAATNFIIPGVQ